MTLISFGRAEEYVNITFASPTKVQRISYLNKAAAKPVNVCTGDFAL